MLIHPDGSEERLWGWDAQTTNNRMELLAAICVLEHLPLSSSARLTTDSQYVKVGITEWVDGGVRRGWRTASNKPVQNADLWRRLIRQRDCHRVEWAWVRGHSGNPMNELADRLAMRARERRLASSLNLNEVARETGTSDEMPRDPGPPRLF